MMTNAIISTCKGRALKYRLQGRCLQWCTVVLRHSSCLIVQEGNGFKALMKGSMPSWAVQEAGAPAEVWVDIQAPEDADSLYLDVIWVNKTATRLPEVSHTKTESTELEKQGWR